jgi:hypothetical protein
MLFKKFIYWSNKLTWGQQQGLADGVEHQSCNNTFCIFKESFLFWQRHVYTYQMFLELGMRCSHFGTKRNGMELKRKYRHLDFILSDTEKLEVKLIEKKEAMFSRHIVFQFRVSDEIWLTKASFLFKKILTQGQIVLNDF